ncbi:hypothetical protein T261_0776 [Streptomyces lydicus]|nr:hypothetical protein T261_0776 [Streptomyces lydicus]
MTATAGDSFLPDDVDLLNISLDDLPGGTTASVPCLDRPDSHGVGHHSQGRILAAEIIELDEMARACARNGIEDKAKGYRTLVAGLLHAYCLIVRRVIDVEAELWRHDDYDYALRHVREDLDESVAFWDPIMREELPPLERYHRLTKVQQARPDVPSLVDLRAQALAEVYRDGGWSYAQLTVETGLPLGRVQQLIGRAGG